MAQVHIHDSEIRRSGSDKALEILQSFIRQEVDVDPRYLSASLTADRLAIKVWLASHRGVYGVPVHGHAGHRHVPHLPRIRAVLGALTDRWTDLGAADACSSLTLGIVTGWLKDAIYSQAKMPKIRGFDEHIQRRQSA